MKMNRALLVIFVLVIFVNLVSGCTSNHQVKPSNRKVNKPTVGEYFIKQSSYLNLYESETGFFPLHLIKVHDGPPMVSSTSEAKSFTLISDQGDIKTASYGYNNGSKGYNYQMQTLSLKLPVLKPGTYQVMSLRIEASGKTTIHQIGSWMIEVMPGKPPADLEIGKHTLASGELDMYMVELKNATKLPVKVESLYMNLNNKPIRIIPKIYRDFEIQKPLSDDALLKPGEKYTFVFKYPQLAGRFFTVKPQLVYSIGEATRSLSLPEAGYYPTLANDQEVLDLVNSISSIK